MQSIGVTKTKMGDLEGALEEYTEAKRIYVLTGTLRTPGVPEQDWRIRWDHSKARWVTSKPTW